MRKPLAALLALLALVCVCGCGVSTTGAQRDVPAAHQPTPAATSPAALRLARRATGALIVDGSTQGSLTAPATRAYLAAGGSDTVAIKNAGTQVAFSELCSGQIDMVDSSGPISSAELAQCEAAGIRPVQIEVASDAVVLATKAETDVGADCLTTPAVKSIFRAGSPVFSWGQLGFDQIPLSVAGPDPSSTAFGVFGQYVVGSSGPSLLDLRNDYHAEPTEQAIRQFVTGSASDTVTASRLTQLLQTQRTQKATFAGAQKTLTDANAAVTEASAQVTKGIADQRTTAAKQQDAANLVSARTKETQAQSAISTQNSALASTRRQIVASGAAERRLGTDLGHLGMFRFSYYALFEGSLRPLEISVSSSPQNCIFPSQQTVTSGAYPLSRQLLITTSVQDSRRPDVREFLLSYLHNAQQLAAQQGLVELPDDVLAREQAFFGGAQQSSASGSSAANVSDTTASPAADLPTPTH